ncbi:hypothetical protein IC229_15440 [Spirosoma sp. BT702]|uniref:Lipoprotein n=1 Tax=Spirosoma profusum TaxID=2771354 RepID=A0A927ARA8_9BACT|nr:hypothetical protein [Spirosoma profusum]MBD2702043.1 hypothetical protein [Spirosoma profusum]
MKTLYKWLVVTIMVSLTGCVTVKSNVQADAIPTFKRVLIVTKLRKASEKYVQGFARQFPRNYDVCTLALTPLSFGNPDEEIRKQVANCQSDVILTLELVQRGQSSQYTNVPYEYDVDMKTAATGQPFWKAIVSSNPTYGEQVPPSSIIKRLLEDHVITGKMASGETAQAIN